MTSASPRAAFRCLLGVVALTAACNSTSAGPVATADAAVDAPAVDVPTSDVGSVADVGAVVDAPAKDAGGCVDFSGGYALTGGCGQPDRSLGVVGCVAQTGCQAQVSMLGRTVPGTVVGDTLTFRPLISALELECTATLSGGALRVQCTSRIGLMCDVRGTRSMLGAASRYCCDVTTQDCGAGQRCAILGNDRMNLTLVTACVPAGTVAAEGACSPADGRIGNADGCARGLHCSSIAAPSGRVCRPLCREDSECAGGQVCFRTATQPTTGVCVRGCVLGGSECATGTSCRGLQGATFNDFAPRVYSLCDTDGTIGEGETCAGMRCQAGLVCAQVTSDPVARCRRNCDATHACPAGSACGPFGGMNESGIGACFAMP